MTVGEFWNAFTGFLQCSAAYFTAQALRCLLFSLCAFVPVLLLRKTLLKKRVFFRWMLWGIFLLIPFMGKMQILYDYGNFRLAAYLGWIAGKQWVQVFYAAGVVISGTWILGRKRRISRFIKKLPEGCVGQTQILVSGTAVTPFTLGVLHSRIVLPRVMLDTFSEEELESILYHEKMHIRLGHLWCYLFWDILCILFWPNILFVVSMKYFREDLEAVCDRVVIQKCGGNAYAYGRMLLKSIQVLQEERPGEAATLIGEEGFENMRQRFMNVADYKPYRFSGVVGLCGAGILLMAGALIWIKGVSYPNYREREMWLLADGYQYREILVEDRNALQEAVSVEEDRALIDMEELEALCQTEGIQDRTFFVCIGGYDKLPGFGGGGGAVYINRDEQAGKVVFSYHNNDREFFTWLFKYL